MSMLLPHHWHLRVDYITPVTPPCDLAITKELCRSTHILGHTCLTLPLNTLCWNSSRSPCFLSMSFPGPLVWSPAINIALFFHYNLVSGGSLCCMWVSRLKFGWAAWSYLFYTYSIHLLNTSFIYLNKPVHYIYHLTDERIKVEGNYVSDLNPLSYWSWTQIV